MKPFGKSYLLDMHGCKEGSADDLELIYRFLVKLVELIKMTPTMLPIGVHGPTKNDLELYPDKAGVSAWVPLIESGVQIHCVEPTHFITLDVYTCGELDPEIVKDFAQATFGFKDCEEHLIERGTKYHS